MRPVHLGRNEQGSAEMSKLGRHILKLPGAGMMHCGMLACALDVNFLFERTVNDDERNKSLTETSKDSPNIIADIMNWFLNSMLD